MVSAAHKFVAHFPQEPDDWDEVILRCKLQDNARQFSVNFCIKAPDGWEESKIDEKPIMYQFKMLFPEEPTGKSEVVQNWWYMNWKREEMVENTKLTDRTQPITLVFRMFEAKMKVFVGAIDHPPDYEYDLTLPLREVCTVEVLEDFQHVEELSFRYPYREK
ncbi:uncharacterized protein LOC131211035 [Anopheles bellator]|uniref:uncharacterized protein LOC131211035 n=1 Tax=Anopheles bellator TaxID=139047 RepID=UPI002647E89D|nr:uncharacterized protein LOC131211035 [Anopheles bellator]